MRENKIDRTDPGDLIEWNSGRIPPREHRGLVVDRIPCEVGHGDILKVFTDGRLVRMWMQGTPGLKIVSSPGEQHGGG